MDLQVFKSLHSVTKNVSALHALIPFSAYREKQTKTYETICHSETILRSYISGLCAIKHNNVITWCVC